MKTITLITTLIIGSITLGTENYSIIEGFALTIIPSICYLFDKAFAN